MDRLFGLDSPTTLSDLVHVGEFHDPVSLAIAKEILTDNGVLFLEKERGAGGVVRILTGYQSFGTDLFVRPEDAEKAADLLLPLLTPADVTDENQEDN